MAIHIHLARTAKPVRDAHPRKANFTIDDIAIGGTVIYKDGSDFKMSKASTKSGMRIKLANGKEISVGDVWSTDASDWKSFETATKDSVESVEKEIRTQQRLIDVAKRMGKDVPGQVMQRMKFLQEELEKAKNPRTDDAGRFITKVDVKTPRGIVTSSTMLKHEKGSLYEVLAGACKGHLVSFESNQIQTADGVKDAEEFKSRNSINYVVRKK